jgi:hypothetical protein
MLRARISNGVFRLELDLRALSPVVRLMALAVHDFCHWRIHPLGRSPRSILRRNSLERPL